MKFGDFIQESLADEAKSEPKTAAAKEAKKLGLTYMGFGRYANSKGQIAYIVDNDRLVPYKSRDEIDNMYYKEKTQPKKVPLTAKKTGSKPEKELNSAYYNKALNSREKEDSKLVKQKMKDAQAVDRELYKFYKPQLFSQEELDAISEYTNESYGPINRFLYKGHDPEVTPEQDERIVQLIQNLDSAFEETQSPFPYTVYTGLSDRYSADKIKVGADYIFRGYLSSSLDFNTAIGTFAGEDNTVVLQIEITKGQKAIYVDPISENPGETETLLPRGTKVKIVSGPHMMDYNVLNTEADPAMISLFHCVIVEDQ